MRRYIIAGNWKMNGTIAQTEALVSALINGKSQHPNAEVVVCPPFTGLQAACKLLQGSHIAIGGQDMSEHERGAYTGDISAELLLTVGCRFVILGHSERRQYHAETDRLVNAKAKAALRAGLTPIICIGETLAQREAGDTERVVGSQIDGSLAEFSPEDLIRSVLAYEPVWAIGTGRTATPEIAQAVHRFIRGRLAGQFPQAAEHVPILYGGSVKGDNAEALLREPDIDGALVGGASLKADEFIAIIQSVERR